MKQEKSFKQEKRYGRQWFKGKEVLVLGLAKSGWAAVRYLHALGAQVTVNDRKPPEQVPGEVRAWLEEHGIAAVFGDHPIHLVHPGLDMIVKNPGIPYRLPIILRAMELTIPVVTEVELGYQWTEAPIVGITGSNGKTTTTTLVGEIFQKEGCKVRVVGNIGTVMSEAAYHAAADETLVVELSSFQLKGILDFHPRVAAILNLYPAHLDYHGTMGDYIAAKNRLFANQTADDVCIFNRDNPYCLEMSLQSPATNWWFSTEEAVHPGVFVRNRQIMIAWPDGRKEPVLPVHEIRLRGVHNLENALAAASVALASGISIASVQEVLRNFTGVAHRLEFVRNVGGVAYYNDSKATNSNAAIKALTSFTEGITWIAGGLDRGNGFDEMIPVVSACVRRLITYGQTAGKLANMCSRAGVKEIYTVHDVTEAVPLAAKLTPPGELVLLSPACASWDMYRSFEERGDMFKQAVHKL